MPNDHQSTSLPCTLRPSCIKAKLKQNTEGGWGGDREAVRMKFAGLPMSAARAWFFTSAAWVVAGYCVHTIETGSDVLSLGFVGEWWRTGLTL